ncbi:MAG TPA: hypothetical protein VFN23_05355 [Ktedonobacteraceae bacterium]|nr:hypothetical protein [Ktedonobacteraceae bacterium]
MIYNLFFPPAAGGVGGESRTPQGLPPLNPVERTAAAALDAPTQARSEAAATLDATTQLLPRVARD